MGPDSPTCRSKCLTRKESKRSNAGKTEKRTTTKGTRGYRGKETRGRVHDAFRERVLGFLSRLAFSGCRSKLDFSTVTHMALYSVKSTMPELLPLPLRIVGLYTFLLLGKAWRVVAVMAGAEIMSVVGGLRSSSG